MVANASGPIRVSYGVPEGTPGRLHTAQRGIFNAPSLIDNPAQDSVYPVASITLTVGGKP